MAMEEQPTIAVRGPLQTIMKRLGRLRMDEFTELAQAMSATKPRLAVHVAAELVEACGFVMVPPPQEGCVWSQVKLMEATDGQDG